MRTLCLSTTQRRVRFAFAYLDISGAAVPFGATVAAMPLHGAVIWQISAFVPWTTIILYIACY